MFRGGKIPDIEGYRSPIQQIVSDMSLKMDNDVCTRVSYWLEGVVPDSTALISLSKAYNVSVDWLCGIDMPREELAYQRGFKDGYEKATKTVITALMEVQKNDNQRTTL